MISVPSLDIDCTPYSILIGIKCTDKFEGLSARLEYGVSPFEPFIVLFDFLKHFVSENA